MTQYNIENIEWLTNIGCVLTLHNHSIFPLFSQAIIYNNYHVEKCRGFVAVLREYSDKCKEKGLIRVSIRLDTTCDIPSKNDILVLFPV